MASKMTEELPYTRSGRQVRRPERLGDYVVDYSGGPDPSDPSFKIHSLQNDLEASEMSIVRDFDRAAAILSSGGSRRVLAKIRGRMTLDRKSVV